MEPPTDPSTTDPMTDNPNQPADEAFGEPDRQPGGQAATEAPVRFLRRDEDSPIAGVASGLARYLGVNPVVIQIAFVVLTVAGAAGLLLYVAGWLLIPTMADPETRPVAVSSQGSRVIFGLLFAVAALSVLFGSLSLGFSEGAAIPLLIIAGGVFLLTQRGSGEPPVADGPSPAQRWAAAEPAFRPPASGPQHWAAPRTDSDVLVESQAPAEPTMPVTSVTLAVAAVVVGLLLGLDQWTSASVQAVVLYGTALAVVGGGLLFSAFRGRALPLIPIGLVLMLGLATAPLADAFADGGVGERTYRPQTEQDVQAKYDLGAGPLVLDLRNVDFSQDRLIEVNVGAGYAEIIVPPDVNVEVNVAARAGYVEVFGRETSGLSPDASVTDAGVSDEDGAANLATLAIDAEITFGYVEVRRG